MILFNFNWRFEQSVLMDEFAMPPGIKNDSFFVGENDFKLDEMRNKRVTLRTYSIDRSGLNLNKK